jgi:tetratricopeptide (TPR) repeat protein
MEIQKSNIARVLFQPSLLFQWWKLWGTLPVISWIIAADEFRKGNFRASAMYYRKGLEKYTQHRVSSYARFDYAYCLYRLNELTQAREELNKIVANRVKLKDAYLLLAKIEGLTGDWFASASVLETCMELFPDDVNVYCIYVHSLLHISNSNDKLEKAIGHLEQIRSTLSVLDHKFVLVNTALARYEYLYGDKKVAEQLIVRVLASGAPPIEAILLRVETLLDNGRLLQARAQLSRAMQIAPQDPRAFAIMARTYIGTNSLQEVHWGLQLALLACQLSAWQNPEYLHLTIDAYSRLGDHTTSLLFRNKLKQLSITRQLNVEEIRNLESQIQQLSELKLPNIDTKSIS